MIGVGRNAFLILFQFWIAQKSCVADATNASCKDGYYYMTGIGCLLCSICIANVFIVRPCTNNVECSVQCNVNNASNPQYIDQEAPAFNYCKNCTKCADLNRKEIASCTPFRDSECGGCIGGYFLGVTSKSEVKCLPCSQCPPGDDTVIKWQQCQNAGLDPGMWCSPGYGSTSDGTTHFNFTFVSTPEVLDEGNFLFFTFPSTVQFSGSYLNSSVNSSIVAVIVLTVVATFMIMFITLCSITTCMIRQWRQATHSYYMVRANSFSTPTEELATLP